jgi:hypothetical protein
MPVRSNSVRKKYVTLILIILKGDVVENGNGPWMNSRADRKFCACGADLNPLHLLPSPAGWSMRVLRAIVEVAALLKLDIR